MRAALALGLCAALAGGAAAAPSVQIRAHTDLRVGPVHKDYDGNYVVSGQLVDKLTGQGIGGYHVRVVLGGKAVDAVTGKDGAFSAAVDAPGGKQDLHVQFGGGDALDPAKLDLQDVDVDKVPLDLQLSVASTTGGAQVTVTASTPGAADDVKVNVPVELDAGPADGKTLPKVGTMTTGGPAFHLTRAAAGGAGRRKVRAIFAGDDVHAAATAEATVELQTATTTTFKSGDTRVAFEDDVAGDGAVVDEDGHGVGHATVAIVAGDRHVAEALTRPDGSFHVTVEAQALGTGRWALQAVVETATAWVKPSRSTPPVIVEVAAPQPVPIAWTVIAAVATAFAAFGFWAGRARPWARWRRAPSAAAAAPTAAPRAEPTAGLVLSRPSLVSTLRRPHDHGFSGVVRDAVRARPVAGATLVLSLGGDRRVVHSDDDGAFAVEELAPGDWAVSCAAPGHVTARFDATIPHRGELRDARVDLLPVRERVFALYRRAALPLLPSPALWGVWSPRQVVDHVRDRRPTPALASLTDFVEEAYFSARVPDEGILPDAEARVEAAVDEQSLV